jgi:hypothetical protein
MIHADFATYAVGDTGTTKLHVARDRAHCKRGPPARFLF